LRHHWKLETVAQLHALQNEFDALFLGIGLSNTHRLGIHGEQLYGVQDAVDFIATLRQTEDLATLPIGREVVVIGGGMTAVDAAVQSKLLGAQEVHMVYRRGPQAMTASKAEQEWAQTHGVTIHHWLAPTEVLPNPFDPQYAGGVRFARQKMGEGKLVPTGETVVFEADMVLKAIGQTLGNPLLAQADFELRGGRIATDANGLTSKAGIWAGGDCRAGGLDLTVDAVQHGKLSAHAIHAKLTASVTEML